MFGTKWYFIKPWEMFQKRDPRSCDSLIEIDLAVLHPNSEAFFLIKTFEMIIIGVSYKLGYQIHVFLYFT